MNTLLYVAGGVTAVGVILRTAVMPIYRWARRLEDALGYVEGQMRHNGGTSVKDAVTRIDDRTQRLEAAVFGPDNKGA